MNYLTISKHTSHIKHRILLYYLGCVNQAKLNENWGYIETHSASGICLDKTGAFIKGSPVIVHEKFPKISMRLCELNEKRFQLLRKQFEDKSQIRVYLGDCNTLLDKLHSLDKNVWYFHFVDPDGIRTDGYDQLQYETVKQIIKWRNSEILLNFPLIPFLRWGSYLIKHPEQRGSIVLKEAFTRFYGSKDWIKYYSPMNNPKWDIENLVNNYIDSLQPYYDQPIQKYLVKTEKNLKVYYLIHGTNHSLGYLFMSKAFKKAEIWTKRLAWDLGQVSLNKFRM